MVTITLPPTRTSAYRAARWEQMHARAGILEVWEGRTERTAKLSGRYFVREHAPTYCRRFQVTKEITDGGNVYWVSIGLNGYADSCDCPGFESNQLCKHHDAVKAIVDAGHFGTLPEDTFSEDIDYLIGELE